MSVRELYEENTNPYELDFLIRLEDAINRVGQEYCSWAYQNNRVSQKIERVFAYELYYQYKKLSEQNGNLVNFRLDGENEKTFNGLVEYCGVRPDLLDTANKNFSDQKHFSPDLVLHLGQTDRQEVNQKLIIEIKTNKKINDKALAKDILKLNHYIRVLNFQYAVLISVNSDFEQLTNQIRRIFPNSNNTLWQGRFRRIIIINYSNRNLQSNHLQNILT